MKKIKLTKNKIALVDNEDYESLNKYKWYASEVKGVFYAKRNVLRSNKGQETILMHRVVLPSPIELDVDHIDNNGLNNQKSNLRVCTRSQNIMNSSLSNKNKSGYKGVSWHKGNNRYMSYIKLEYKQIHLGSFSDPIDAALAYDVAAIKYHGEFAKTNKMLGLLKVEGK